MRRRTDDPARHARPTVNMTPMIDVTFRVIVVFLCSMKFRTLDRKIEATLPDRGAQRTIAPPEVIPGAALRIGMAADGETFVPLVGERMGRTLEGARPWERIAERLRASRALEPRLVGEIDAAPGVAHGDVVSAMDAFLAAGVEDVRFRGTPPPR